MEIAEQTAQAAKDEEVTSTYQYYNAKCLTNESSADLEPCSNLTSILDLTPNPHFWNFSVNTRHSAVHVPTNVFDRCGCLVCKVSSMPDSLVFSKGRFKSNQMVGGIGRDVQEKLQR